MFLSKCITNIFINRPYRNVSYNFQKILPGFALVWILPKRERYIFCIFWFISFSPLIVSNIYKAKKPDILLLQLLSSIQWHCDMCHVLHLSKKKTQRPISLSTFQFHSAFMKRSDPYNTINKIFQNRNIILRQPTTHEHQSLSCKIFSQNFSLNNIRLGLMSWLSVNWPSRSFKQMLKTAKFKVNNIVNGKRDETYNSLKWNTRKNVGTTLLLYPCSDSFW